MSHGLCMVDAEQRLVLFNQRFLEMYDLSPEVARIGMPMADLIAHSAERGNFPAAQLEEIKRAPPRHDGARRAVPAAAPDVARAHLRDGLSPARRRRLGHAGRGRDRAPAQGIRPARPVRALRPGDQSHVARAVRGRCRAPHRAVQRAVPGDVRPVGRRHPGRRLDARHDRARGAARIFPQCHARAGLAAAAGEDGAAQAVPAASEPAQRPRIHPALSSDGGRRLGHAVRGRDRAPPHGARTAPAVRALRPGGQPHVARAVHVRPGRAADRVQRALSRDLRARSRGHQARRHASRTARALDRERQRARHVGRGVLREAQGRGRPARRSRPCSCT